jgi:WD40 repeat protein
MDPEAQSGGSPRRPPPLVPDHQLLRPVGRGAYGEVWLARNVMGTLRAVKVVRRDAFEEGRPYEREFQGVRHYEPVSRGSEALVHILHVGRDDDAGLFYYVMELADDEDPTATVLLRRASGADAPETYVPRTLRTELRRLGRLPLGDVLDLATSLASGLGHLHRHGLVHRDIKPANIIRVHGAAKLADPGLAGLAGESRTFVGTEGFVPPEGPGSVRADIYALGKVLYEASTGLDRNRFPEIPSDWIGDPTAADRIEFHEVVLRACEGDPARRYPDAAALAADVALLRSGRSVRALRRLERRAAAVRLVAVVAAVLLSVVGTAWWAARRDVTRERELRVRIAAAERDARLRLQQSWVARARAERLAGGFGARTRAVAALREAASLGDAIRDEPSWRQESTAARALWEMRWSPLPETMSEAPSDPMWVATDRTHAWLGTIRGDGEIRLRNRTDGTVRTQSGPGWLPDQLTEITSSGNAIRVRNGQADWIGHLPSGSWFPAKGAATLAPDGASFVHMDSRGRPVRVRIPEASAGPAWQADPGGGTRWSLLSFSPSGQRVAAAETGRARVVLWDPESGAVVGEIATDSEASSLAWSADGLRIAVGTHGGGVLLCALPDTDPVWILAVHAGSVRCLTMDPTGRLLFSGADDETVHLIDAGHGIDLGHGAETAWNALFSPDGRSVGPVAENGTNGLLHIEPPSGLTRVRTRGLGGSNGALAWTADGTGLMGTSEGGMHRWDPLGTWIRSWTLPGIDQLFAQGTRIWFRNEAGIGSIDPQAAGAEPSWLRQGPRWSALAFDGGAAEPLVADSIDERIRISAELWCEGLLERPRRIAVGSSFIVGASASMSNLVVWNRADGRRLRNLLSSPGATPSFDLSGRWLAVADREPRIWDTLDWTWRALPGGGARAAASFDPKGRFLAVATGGREVRRVRLPALEPMTVLEGPVGIRIVAVTVSPDGHRIAAQGRRGEILLWDTREADADAPP